MKNRKEKVVDLRKDCSKCISSMVAGEELYCKLRLKKRSELMPSGIVLMEECDWFKEKKWIE